MAGSLDPGTQRRRLGRELRVLRERKGITQGDAAEGLEWSLTKINRLEKGTVSISITDLKALLALYGQSNDEKIDRLTVFARTGRGQSWADRYKDVITNEYAQYLALEGSASSLRVFAPFLVPGLLQTEDYATALANSHQETPHNHRLVELRMQRQAQIFGEPGESNQDDPPQLTFLLSEAALHQSVGGPEVMAAQLKHVLHIGQRPNVKVGVIPYSAGAHPGLLGSTILIQLPDGGRAVFNEGRAEGLIEDSGKGLAGESAVIKRAVGYFETMEELALLAEESAELIEEMIEFFTSQVDRGVTDYPVAAHR